MAGVAPGSHHDANGGTGIPLCGDRSELLRDRGFEKIDEVRLESRHKNLGLRISKPAIKLQHAWAILGKHQPGEEQPAKPEMIFLDAANKRFQDRLPNFLQKRCVQPLRRAEGSHTSGVRPSIPVIKLFMILGSGEEEVRVPIHESVDRALGAGKEFFDHYFPTCISEAASLDHIVDGCFGFGAVLRNDDTFPESQAIGFDGERESEFAQASSSLPATIRIRRSGRSESRDEP